MAPTPVVGLAQARVPTTRREEEVRDAWEAVVVVGGGRDNTG